MSSRPIRLLPRPLSTRACLKNAKKRRVILLSCGYIALALSAQAAPPEKLVATSFGDANPSQPYIAIHQPNIPGYKADHFARPYLGDGLLGIRPNPNPLSQSETVAAGFVFSNAQGVSRWLRRRLIRWERRFGSTDQRCWKIRNS